MAARGGRRKNRTRRRGKRNKHPPVDVEALWGVAFDDRPYDEDVCRYIKGSTMQDAINGLVAYAKHHAIPCTLEE